MPKLEAREMNPMFRLTATDARLIATETVRRHAVPASAPRTARPATDKQVSFLTKLSVERGTATESEIVALAAKGLDSRTASQMIDALLAQPRIQRPVSESGQTQVTDGFYKLGDDFVKVQEAKNGTGRPYAKRWDGGSWEYEPGLVRKITPEMALTPEQAKEWGDLYGCCIYCSRDLTDERSIAAGYGPTCADKRGLPWG